MEKTIRGSSIGTWMGKSTKLGMFLFIENKVYSCQYMWKEAEYGSHMEEIDEKC